MGRTLSWSWWSKTAFRSALRCKSSVILSLSPSPTYTAKYQIRFLGFKGVVAVDKELDKGKIRMRLRDSMKKFDGGRPEKADIEIARAFERPNMTYLNRFVLVRL